MKDKKQAKQPVRQSDKEWDTIRNAAKYGCHLLVYYQGFHSIEEAIIEEKRIKGGNRKSKLKLIEAMNPEWEDLWEEI